MFLRAHIRKLITGRSNKFCFRWKYSDGFVAISVKWQANNTRKAPCRVSFIIVTDRQAFTNQAAESSAVSRTIRTGTFFLFSKRTRRARA